MNSVQCTPWYQYGFWLPAKSLKLHNLGNLTSLTWSKNIASCVQQLKIVGKFSQGKSTGIGWEWGFDNYSQKYGMVIIEISSLKLHNLGNLMSLTWSKNVARCVQPWGPLSLCGLHTIPLPFQAKFRIVTGTLHIPFDPWLWRSRAVSVPYHSEK